MNVAGADPKHHAVLKYFPPQTGVRFVNRSNKGYNNGYEKHIRYSAVSSDIGCLWRLWRQQPADYKP